MVVAEKAEYEFIFSDCNGKILPALGGAYGLETVVNNALLDEERSAPVREALGATRMVEGDADWYADLERALMDRR